MGAQSSLLNLVSQSGVAASKGIGTLDINKDEQMADYARKMRDAKLKTEKTNLKIARARLQNLKKGIGGEE